MKYLLLALTMGCATTHPSEQPTVSDTPLDTSVAEAAPATEAAWSARPGWERPHIEHQRVQEDLQYAVDTLNKFPRHIESLPAGEQQLLWAATRDLATNCPYSRAGFLLTLTLERELSALDGTALPDASQQQLALLLRGVQAQAHGLEAMRGDQLPLPLPSDFLSTVSIDLVTAEALAVSSDAIGLTLRALQDVPATLDEMTPATQSRIQDDWKVVDRYTSAILVNALAALRWNRDLQQLHSAAASLNDPALSEHLDRLLVLLDSYLSQNC